MRRASVLLGCVAVAGLVVAGVRALHAIVNLTPSMPLGIYRLIDVTRAPQRGDIVVVCAPPALARFAAARKYLPPGPCAAGTAPLLKRVAAVAGDRVLALDAAVSIDGVRLPGSARRARDEGGRPIPFVARGAYLLRGDEIWLWTPAPHGWDSRYYGALHANAVRAFAVPLVTQPQR